MSLEVCFFLVLAYLLGSIPFGLILAKHMGAGDLRQIGSGNIGATNAMRTGNKKLGALVLVCDLLKGTLSVLIVALFIPYYSPLAGLAAVVGHMYPVWLKGKGGKGVATSLGILIALNPLIFVLTALTWLGTFHFTRISSLGALAAFTLCPIYAWVMGDAPLALVMLLIAALIYHKHRSNIARILSGEEAAFKRKPRDEPPADE